MEAIRLREDAATIHAAAECAMPNSPSKKGSRGIGNALAADVKKVARVMVNRAAPLLGMLVTPGSLPINRY